MKKIILSLAILSAGVFSINAANPNTDEKPSCKASTECTCKCGKGEKGGKNGKMSGKHHGKRQNLFEGITLTAEQQTQLENLRKNRKHDEQAGKSAASTEDVKKAREARSEARAKRMQEFSSQVQTILTPEQYTIFQENVKKMEARKQAKQDGRVKGDTKKGNKKSHKKN